jgi:uncharacterized RDD family membrane protein YckC
VVAAQSVRRGVVTPEAVLLEFETSGLPSRAIGEAIDLTIQIAMLLALSAALGVFAAVGGTFPTWVGAVLLTIVSFLVIFGYPALSETLWNGKTIGKAALGLRVVTTDGAPIRFRHAAIRSALGIVDLLVPPFGVTATVSMLLTSRNQRLGDLAAGTIVLRERSGAVAAQAVAFPAPAGLDGYVASLDVAGLSEAEYGLIRNFLTRVFELAPNARASLSVRLANPVAVKLHHQPPGYVGPELYLACVAAAYQRRHGGPATWQPSDRPMSPLPPPWGPSPRAPPPPTWPPPPAAPPPPTWTPPPPAGPAPPPAPPVGPATGPP